jgi:hypothetical protein
MKNVFDKKPPRTFLKHQPTPFTFELSSPREALVADVVLERITQVPFSKRRLNILH